MAISVDKKIALLDIVKTFDNVPDHFERKPYPYYPLYLPGDDRPHGYITPSNMEKIPWSSAFSIDHEKRRVTLGSPPPGTTLSAYATAAFDKVVNDCIAQKIYPWLTVESERFRIIGARGLVKVQRYASSLFGIASRGSHLTCYVRDRGRLLVWVAKRSSKLATYPGLLDSTVAGGVKAEHTPYECIKEEAQEEASLPDALQISEVGTLSLSNFNDEATKSHFNDGARHHSEVLWLYDAELPVDVVPSPNDDEVEEFTLMSWEEVYEKMCTGEFKQNVCNVMIDFFIRHGVITSDNDKDYVDTCRHLRRKIPVATVPDTEEGWAELEGQLDRKHRA